MLGVVLLIAGFAWPSGVYAQEPIDVGRLPIDVERIQRELRQVEAREEADGLGLRYFIEVYGQAPRLVIFGPEDNLVYGPVPYGAPTHREMLEQMTPREFRTPTADFTALIQWLLQQASRK